MPLVRAASGLESVAKAPQHVYLSLENITGTGMPGDYKVYLEMPGAGEPVLAGILTTFGLDRASDPDREHGGSGLSHVFEITELAAHRPDRRHGVAAQVEIRPDRRRALHKKPRGLESFARPAAARQHQGRRGQTVLRLIAMTPRKPIERQIEPLLTAARERTRRARNPLAARASGRGVADAAVAVGRRSRACAVPGAAPDAVRGFWPTGGGMPRSRPRAGPPNGR